MKNYSSPSKGFVLILSTVLLGGPRPSPALEQPPANLITQELSSDTTSVTLNIPTGSPDTSFQIWVEPHRADLAPSLMSIAATSPVTHVAIPLTSPSMDLTVATRDSQQLVHLGYDFTPLNFPFANQSPLIQSLTGEDYPRDRNEAISTESEVQGAAHDSTHWYISNTKSVTQIPLSTDLNDVPRGLPTYRIPADLASRYNHIGDVDFFNGSLYVPLEGGEPLVSIVDPATMKEKSRTPLAPRGDTAEIPWVALNPLDGMLTSSTFNISATPYQHLRAYTLPSPSNQLAKLHHTVVLTDPQGAAAGMLLAHAQGAAFSKEGHLYVVSDADDNGPAICNIPQTAALHLGCHGLYAFGLEEPFPAGAMVPANAYGVPTLRRRLLFFTPLERKTKKINLIFTTIDVSQELEGLDIFEIPAGVSPGISGMVHILMSHADSGVQHSFWFKHFDVSTAAARWWF